MSATQTEPTVRVGHPERCRRCGMTVAWARSLAGKSILMDFAPAPLGEYVIAGSIDNYKLVCKVKVHGPGESRYMCHFDTCGNARPKAFKNRYRRRLTPDQEAFKKAFDARARKAR